MVFGADHSVNRQVTGADLLPLAIYAGCLIAVHVTLVVFRFRGDQILLGAVAFLAGLGLLAQYRMGSLDTSSGSQLGFYVFPAGILIMLSICVGGMRGRYNRLAPGIWVWAGFSLVLVVALLATGQRFRGAVYGAGFVTPTEILKVTVVLFLAGYIDRHARVLGKWKRRVLPPVRELLPLIAFWTALSGLLLAQRDLGMFMILSIPLLAMLYFGTGAIGYLAYGVLTAAGLGYLVLKVFAHGQRRIQAWVTPFEDPTGSSWQILQGLSGMYSGGLWGEGFGEGNPEYTPIAESDFIYSVIGEELGFLGSALVIVFFLVVFHRGYLIAFRTRSRFGMLLCGGLVTVIAVQTFLNVGGVTKFIPLTGITLPFISHGGSSLLTGFASLGLILAVSDGEAAAARRKRAPSSTRPRTPPTTRPSRPKRSG
jgi:cell division protein FtsW (lipid II flippase)